MFPRPFVQITAGAGAAFTSLWRYQDQGLEREPWTRRQRFIRCDDGSESLRVVSKALLEPTIQYSELHGLLYGAVDRSTDSSAATQCPVAMLPFKITEKAFQECVDLSPLWNTLIDAAARNLPWLYATLEQAANADPFTKRLIEISRAVHSEGLRQPLMLGIHRSDYMLHEPAGAPEAPRFFAG